MSAAIAAALSSPQAQAAARAKATVRIEKAVRVTKEEWDRSARREIRIVENGRPITIRVIEHE